jgi:hypothetical protein
MPVARPGPKPQFTEEFLVKLRPDQREALDAVAEVSGVSRSEALRRFVDQGFATFRAALEAVAAASPEEVAAAAAAIDQKESHGST